MTVTLEQTLAFGILAFVMSITPGPNNMMALSSGLNFGVRKTVPHLIGISFGCALLLAATALGLHSIFDKYPIFQLVIKYVGATYLIVLAWKISRAKPLREENSTHSSKPIGFFGAAIFQWVNPKSWIMAISAVSTYLPVSFNIQDIMTFSVVFAAISFPCVALWAFLGTGLHRFLQKPTAITLFNYGTAVMLITSLYPIFI